MSIQLKENFLESIDFIGRLIKFQMYKMPETANCDITGKCNARCKHCYFFKSWDSSRELNDEEWISAFKKHRQRLLLIIRI